jgi:aminoglycoside phosphotransferase family enzyme/predicted kinase
MPHHDPSAEAATRAHVVEDQSAVFAFLADPMTHGLSEAPRRIDTQSSVVFLAGEDVYKVKRAVKFPFMDLSTLEKRKAACETEIEVNHADAPSIYLKALPITRSNGRLRIDGDGEAVEWVVHMRRFDETKTLDHVAEKDGLPPPLLAKLVRAILASHARAPLRPGLPAAESLRRYVSQSDAAFKESPELFPTQRVNALTQRSDEMLDRCWSLMLERGDAGYVRRCHGDLHLRNIVLLNGEPTLFDAIEFSDEIATADVLYDLAFLLMDLWERGLKSEANLVLNRYLWGSEEAQIKGLAALPIFLSIRAAIRSKVIAAGLPHLSGAEQEKMAQAARQYFRATEDFLKLEPPRLIAFGGLSGSGKTTLAAQVAPHIGTAPGAIHLRSDVERKLIAGVAETERLPADAYTLTSTGEVYTALRRKAELALATGCSVIVDAVHSSPAERQQIEAAAADIGVPFLGLWLDAPAEVLMDRVRTRMGDASDAMESVVERQLGYDLGEIRWSRLDATIEMTQRVKRALCIIAR